MAGHPQRWGYVHQQRSSPFQKQQQQQHQEQRQHPDINSLVQTSSAIERTIGSSPTYTVAVSVASSNMLPSSSSSSTLVSDSDAIVMMEASNKVDPLDLTCNSHQSNNNSSRISSNSGMAHRMTELPDAGNHVPAAGGARSMFANGSNGANSDCDIIQRSRMMASSGLPAAPTGSSGTAASASSGIHSAGGSSTSEEAHRCDMCGKTFAVPARLTRHYRTHTGERPFVCEVCGKSFSVKENLSVHRRIHTKEKPYRCPHCGRGFEHSGKLHRHMRIHTGERPHQCSDCGKTFIQSGQLVIHMRSHTGEKPYVCSVCNKGFTCSKQLKVHSRTHTGERPYACDVCGKTFAYNHVLKLHQMAHLGERLYKCTLCSETYSSKKSLEAHIKMHGSPTRQSPVPSTSSSAANSSAAPSSGSIAHVRQQVTAADFGRRPTGRHLLSSGGLYVDQAKKVMAGQHIDGAAERLTQHNIHQQPSSLSPSSAESSRSSPSDMDGAPPQLANSSNGLLMEAPRSFQQHPAGVHWNMLNGIGLPRHHMAHAQQYDGHHSAVPLGLQERNGTSFAYPQLLNNVGRERIVGLPVTVEPKVMPRHNFNNGQHLAQLKPATSQPTTADFSSVTYLRPMPPLIPVAAAGPMVAALPTSLRSLEHQGNHSPAPESSAAVPTTNIRQVEGSTSSSRGPPRKSFRFRGGDGGSSESPDSPPSSASSSPSLMTDVIVAADVGQVAPLPDGMRSTSVIRFAHRPNVSTSPTSTK